VPGHLEGDDREPVDDLTRPWSDRLRDALLDAARRQIEADRPGRPCRRHRDQSI
jgi:hypothetical protein